MHGSRVRLDGSRVWGFVMTERVLVLGARTGLTRALRRLRVEAVTWPKADPFPAAREEFEAAVRALPGSFTHVIAGTEAAVIPAAWARRALGARTAPFAIALRCHDKLTMKRHLRSHDIPMTPFLDAREVREPAAVLRDLGTPVVVKARASSGGRGISFARDEPTLQASLARAPRRDLLVERFVNAKEMSVESFVVDGKIVFENFTSYLETGGVNLIPARIRAAELEAVRQLNRKVIKAMRITWGVTHLEVYLTDDGPLFGEVALRPPGGYIMETMSLAWGFDAWEAFVGVELEREVRFPEKRVAYAAGWVMHPGPGKVARVAGEDAMRAMPEVRDLKLKVTPGDVVTERLGVGQDVGRALFAAPTRKALMSALKSARSTMKIIVE